MLLLGMRAVALPVHHVVDEVDPARDQAEDREARRRQHPAASRSERTAEEEWQGQDEILDPLRGPRGLEQSGDGPAPARTLCGRGISRRCR